MNTEPDSIIFKCGLEETESSLRQGHLDLGEDDLDDPFYDLKKEKAVE